jgi:hypothetical protein
MRILMPRSRKAVLLLLASACLVLGPATSVSAPGPQEPRGKDDPAPAKEVTFKAPKGWKAVEATQFLVAKFEVRQGEQTGTFTVAKLAAPAGGLAANLNRWRAQVGLDLLTDEEVLKAAREVKVGELKGHAVDLKGPPKDGQHAQRIMGTVVTRGDQVWFFKLTGPAEFVGRQKTAFNDLLISVKFRRP